MRKMMALLSALALLMVCVVPASAATEDSLIVNKQYEDPITNAIANVQRVHGDSYEAALSAENTPGVALCEAGELADMKAFIQRCSQAKAIPVISVRERKEAEMLIQAVTELEHKDVTAVSDDASLLKYIRNKKLTIRTGLYVTLEKDTVTSDEAHIIRTTVRGAPATFCVIDSAFASRQLVAELQELALAVWVDTTNDTDVTVSTVKAITSGANGVITENAYDTAQLMNATFEDHTMTRTPIMIGHRGNPTQAPENSLSGFLTAYENGADVFEIDVEITKDGEIIIMHDDTLNRTTNYQGDLAVRDMTLEEIKQYRLLANNGAVSDEEVPTLREVLEEFRDKDCRIFVEFKGNNKENVPVALELVKEYEMEDRIDVISFNSSFLTQAQTEIEGMSTGFLQSPAGVTSNAFVAVNTFYASIIATQSANSTINPGKGVMSETYMQTATDRGMTVWPWTYAKATARMAFALCPDGITTDDVQWSKDMLKYIESNVDSLKVLPGSAVEVDVFGTTYGRATNTIADEDRIVKVISGDELISVEDGVITADGSGTAQIIIGCKAQTTDGVEYVLYTQPITVTSTYFTPTVITVLVIVGVALVILLFVVAAVAVTVLSKKSKQK